MYELNIIDKIIKEPTAEDETENFNEICNDLKKEILSEIKRMQEMSDDEIVEERYQKFRNMGEYITL